MTQEINHELGSVNVYHYDAGGNLSYCNSGLYDPNHITELWKDKTYTYGDANWKDKLTAYNGKAITYDKIGNPLTYDGWTYTWEAGRQLKKQEKGTTSIEYTYDENGLRTQKKTTENDKTTVYDYVWKGDRLIGLTIDAGISIEYLYFFYDEDGKAAGFVHDNKDVYFYQSDAQGNVNAIVKQDGTTAAQYTYDAWGNLLSSKGEMAKINPLTYRGYQYDQETGLYYLQSRYYNPEWGRFINADSIIDTQTSVVGTNMFAYCDNNPVNSTDPIGKYTTSQLEVGFTQLLYSLYYIYDIIGMFGFSTESFDRNVNKILNKIPNYGDLFTTGFMHLLDNGGMNSLYNMLQKIDIKVHVAKEVLTQIKSYCKYVFGNHFLKESYFGGALTIGGNMVNGMWSYFIAQMGVSGVVLEKIFMNGWLGCLVQLFSIADRLMNKNLSSVEKAVLIVIDFIMAVVIFTLGCLNTIGGVVGSIVISIISPMISCIATRTVYYLNGRR